MKKTFTLQKTGSLVFITRALLFFERLVWFFGAALTILILVFGYRFVLLPQYHRLVQARESERKIELQEYEQKLGAHLARLNAFISKTSSITTREHAQLDLVLPHRPDELILHQELSTFFDGYGLDTLQYNITPAAATGGTPGSGSTNEDGSTFNPLALLPGGEGPSLGSEQPSEGGSGGEKVEFDNVGVTVTFTADDYFAAKDIIADLERRVPIMDAENVSITITPETGATHVSLTLTLRFLKEGA